MLMQNFGVTNKDYYGMLCYFLEWSIVTQQRIVDDEETDFQQSLIFESQCSILLFRLPRASGSGTPYHHARGKLQVPIALTLFQLALKHFYQ